MTAIHAAELYARSREAIAPRPAPERAPVAAPDFAALAADLAAGLRRSEAAAAEALRGGGDPQTVVLALAETEIAVETAVAIRNRVVEAYQELLRMPV